MKKPRTYQTEAIIIKKMKLGEADRILTFYTPHLGKIRGIAKSVRRPKSKLAGHLELLTHSHVSLARGRNLDTVIGSQTINSFLHLKNDFELTSYALYIIELVNQFTPDGNENYPLYQLLLDSLHRLSQASNRELLLHYFELHLLDQVGYRPQLQQCTYCHTNLKPASNAFSPITGGVVCPDCYSHQPLSYPLSVDGLKVLRFIQNNDYPLANRLKINHNLSREIHNIMSGYFRYLLEKELKSVAWLDKIRKQKEGATTGII